MFLPRLIFNPAAVGAVADREIHNENSNIYPFNTLNALLNFMVLFVHMRRLNRWHITL